MTDLITPAMAIEERLGDEGFSVSANPREVERRRREYLLEVLRLTRLIVAPLCGMTSRPDPPYIVHDHPAWTGTDLPGPVPRRLGGAEVATECGQWAWWLFRALAVSRTVDRDGNPEPMPLAEVAELYGLPPTRLFKFRTWPTFGREAPGPPRRRPRARRS